LKQVIDSVLIIENLGIRREEVDAAKRGLIAKLEQDAKRLADTPGPKTEGGKVPIGNKEFTYEELIHEVEKETPVGIFLLHNHLRVSSPDTERRN